MPKTKLTPELQKRICDNITLGMPLKFAAEASGISEATFHRWMADGDAAQKGMFRDFFDAVKESQSKAVQLHLTMITKAAKEGNWQASAWILERRHPDEFGRKDRINMDANINHSGRVDIHKLSDEELLEIIASE